MYESDMFAMDYNDALSKIDLLQLPRIVAAALESNGMIITSPPPARHHTLLKMLWDYALHNPDSVVNQGFITNEGKFVGRKEAKQIAKVARQKLIPNEHEYNEDLFSEDLW